MAASAAKAGVHELTVVLVRSGARRCHDEGRHQDVALKASDPANDVAVGSLLRSSAATTIVALTPASQSFPMVSDHASAHIPAAASGTCATANVHSRPVDVLTSATAAVPASVTFEDQRDEARGQASTRRDGRTREPHLPQVPPERASELSAPAAAPRIAWSRRCLQFLSSAGLPLRGARPIGAGMQLSVGYSVRLGEQAAAQEAVQAALAGGGDPKAAVVFASDRYDAQALATALDQELQGLAWAGCSSAGVIAHRQLMLGRAVAVGVLCGDLHASVGLAEGVSANPRRAGQEAVQKALRGRALLRADDGRSLIMMADAQSGNLTEVVRGAAQEGGASAHWAGGGAGDNFRSTGAWAFAGGRAARDAVAVLSLDCRDPVAVSAGHGWRPYGAPAMVTRASGSTVIELDDQPAFDVYCRTAAEAGDAVEREGFAAFAMLHPLGIPQVCGPALIRDPIAVDPEGGLRCVGEVPEGTLVRVMVGDRRELLQVGAGAAAQAELMLPTAVHGAILFDCFSRSEIFGEELEREVAAVEAVLGDVPVIGALTLGEVAALRGGVPQLLNKAAVVMAL